MQASRERNVDVQPPADDGRRLVFLSVNASFAHSNFAAWTLRSRVEIAGWQFHEVEALISQNPGAVLRQLLRLKPAALAATFYLFNSQTLLAILQRFNALQPNCPILAGGPEFLGDNRGFLTRNPAVSAVIRGEGEVALSDWLRLMNQSDEQLRIAGLCCLRDGHYYDNGMAATLTDLDAAPPPYEAPLINFHKPFVMLETTRGCGNRCSFCTSGTGGPVRRRSLDRIRTDLRLIQQRGVREVRLLDRTFNERPSHYLPLLRCLRDEFAPLRVHLEIDPALVNDELIAELAAAEPRRFHLEIGIQSLDPAVQKAIGRRGSPGRSLTGLQQLCALPGIDTHTDLIAGLPLATLDGLLADLQQLVRARPDVIQLETLKLLPGTQLAEERDRWMVVAAPIPPYEVLQTASMTLDELETARLLSRAVDGFYNAPELRALAIEASEQQPAFWQKLIAHSADSLCGDTMPSLENRFRLLDSFWRLSNSTMLYKLHYAWLRHGFSAQHGLCPVEVWKGPLPANARLLEGTVPTGKTRVFTADLDRLYAFVFTNQRAATAVYEL